MKMPGFDDNYRPPFRGEGQSKFIAVSLIGLDTFQNICIVYAYLGYKYAIDVHSDTHTRCHTRKLYKHIAHIYIHRGICIHTHIHTHALTYVAAH
jgi:hypothetical protein